MILEALVKHYQVLKEQGKAAEPGWCTEKVSFSVQLRKDGSLLGITSLKEDDVRGKKTVWRPKNLRVPERVSRSSGINSNFLCDNSKYILGIDASGSGKREKECFENAKEKHLKILGDTEGEMAEAVRNFFLRWNPDLAETIPDIKENWEEITGGNLVFKLGMEYAQENREIQLAWQKACDETERETEGICLVTGERTSISRTHTPVKGVAGAQSSGAALVSFNAPSFESYGKEQSYNAPVGKRAMFGYTTALNYLLADKKHVLQMGDTTVLFWAEEGEEVYQDAFLAAAEPSEDNQEIVAGVLQNIAKGEMAVFHQEELNPAQQFYILGLAPNAARLSVRFFFQNHFGKLLEHVAGHYERMKIVKPSWDKREYVGIKELLEETVNKNAKEKRPSAGMAASVFLKILAGERYPESLYQNTLQRIRAEQGTVTRGRAGIVKAYLIQNKNHFYEQEENFVGVNEPCKDPAYVLGREFAVLEQIQETANPGINTTIKDRYFNAACATPATIFPIIQKLKNSHIRKLEEGQKIFFEKQLTDLQGKLSEIPKNLTLEEQGVFILGYYHQTQKRYEKKENK